MAQALHHDVEQPDAALAVEEEYGFRLSCFVIEPRQTSGDVNPHAGGKRRPGGGKPGAEQESAGRQERTREYLIVCNNSSSRKKDTGSHRTRSLLFIGVHALVPTGWFARR